MSTDTETLTRTQLKLPSMWKVILHNDDFTPMDFVTEILVHVFRKPVDEAMEIMLTVHEKGRANVGLYTKEIAETKVAQCKKLAEGAGHPLLTTAEEA